MTIQERIEETGAAQWFAARAKHPAVQYQTHWAACYRSHPDCAYWRGVDTALEKLNAARDTAVLLEQELAETQRRCRELAHEWTETGSMLHAAQLAEALELSSPE